MNVNAASMRVSERGSVQILTNIYVHFVQLINPSSANVHVLMILLTTLNSLDLKQPVLFHSKDLIVG